jgi:hypothetical protein
VAAHLADRFGLDFVELDALNWKPNWTPSTDAEFREKLAAATAGDRWAVAGAYHHITFPMLWPRAETVVWLDFPLPVLTWRLLRRSWRRWRSKEVLWGTNTERFWPQLKAWNKEDSLIAFTWSAHRGKIERYEAPRTTRSGLTSAGTASAASVRSTRSSAKSKRLQNGQVFRELEIRDMAAVPLPLDLLVLDQAFEHVVAKRFAE